MNEQSQYNELKKGCEYALKMLYEAYFAPLCVYARSFIQDKDCCKDIVHESFIKLWKNRKRMNSYGAIINFLYTCVHNHCLNEIRRLNYKNKIASIQNNIAIKENDIIENEVKCILWTEISHLSTSYRNILSMSLEGFSIKEISEKLELSEQTVKNKKTLAVKKLKKKLEYLQYSGGFFIL